MTELISTIEGTLKHSPFSDEQKHLIKNLMSTFSVEQEILAELEPLLRAYAQERTEGERFGDFVIRKGIVQEIKHGNEFKH